MEYNIIFVIICFHFVADFVLQSDQVTFGKSSCNKVLLEHVIFYSIPFLVFGLAFALINTILHYLVDWVTSRLAKKVLLERKDTWYYATVITDQLLHLGCLLGTYYWIFVR